jgi:hypothetical protein
LIFFTARLRGDFGSIAITVNPLRHHNCNGLLWPKSPWANSLTVALCVRYFVKLPKFNESAAGAISIASRAELLAHYGRLRADIPKIRSFTPDLATLFGVNILQKTKADQISEHAGAAIREEG